VFVPTHAGPLGGIVTEPDGDPVGAAAILQGSSGRRSGVGQIWTNLGRAMADLGLVVLRVDHPGKGDSKPAATPPVPEVALVEGLRWFRERTGGLDLHLVGLCYGVRTATAFARQEPALSGLTLLRPYLVRPQSRGSVTRARRRLRRGLGAVRPRPIDARLGATIVDVARRAPTVVVVGERDVHVDHAIALSRGAGAEGVHIELDVVSGGALHDQRSVAGQRATVTRLVGWVSRAVDGRSDGSGPGLLPRGT
jgi:pimeloyl-ACP methyl ester carboxylesterase